MPGNHGTIVEYIRAYDRYGGKPPVPEDAPVRRGENRSRRCFALGMGLGVTTLVVVFVLGAYAASTTTIPTSIVMFAAGMAAMGLDLQVITPVQDWYDDTPRRGLESVDQEYGLLPASPGGAE